MENISHDIASCRAMQERARQIMELTYQDWRLHERPLSARKKAVRFNASVRHNLAVLARIRAADVGLA